MKGLFTFLTIFISVNLIAQVGVGTSSPNSSAKLEVSSTSQGFLPPRMTYAQRNTISNPAQGLIIYCTNCGTNGEAEVFNGVAWTNISGTSAQTPLPGITTTSASNISNSTIVTGGNATVNGGPAITATGVCWSTTQGAESINGNHSTDATAAGSFTSNLKGLTANTTYYLKAYASNSGGTSYGSEITFTTQPAIITSGLTLNLDATNYSGTGTTWNDVSGNANNATLVGSPVYSPNNGGYFQLNGACQASSFSSSISPGGNSRTINIWCKPGSTSRIGLATTRNDNLGQSGWFLNINMAGSGVVSYYHMGTTSGNTGFNANGGISSGSWYMITITYDLATQTGEIFVNGVSKGTATFPREASTAYTGAAFLEDSDASSPFIGDYASLFIYDRVLSSAEIQSNFNSMKGRFGL